MGNMSANTHAVTTFASAPCDDTLALHALTLMVMRVVVGVADRPPRCRHSRRAQI